MSLEKKGSRQNHTFALGTQGPSAFPHVEQFLRLFLTFVISTLEKSRIRYFMGCPSLDFSHLPYDTVRVTYFGQEPRRSGGVFCSLCSLGRRVIWVSRVGSRSRPLVTDELSFHRGVSPSRAEPGLALAAGTEGPPPGSSLCASAVPSCHFTCFVCSCVAMVNMSPFLIRRSASRLGEASVPVLGPWCLTSLWFSPSDSPAWAGASPSSRPVPGRGPVVDICRPASDGRNWLLLSS